MSMSSELQGCVKNIIAILLPTCDGLLARLFHWKCRAAAAAARNSSASSVDARFLAVDTCTAEPHAGHPLSLPFFLCSVFCVVPRLPRACLDKTCYSFVFGGNGSSSRPAEKGRRSSGPSWITRRARTATSRSSGTIRTSPPTLAWCSTSSESNTILCAKKLCWPRNAISCTPAVWCQRMSSSLRFGVVSCLASVAACLALRVTQIFDTGGINHHNWLLPRLPACAHNLGNGLSEYLPGALLLLFSIV